MGAGARGYRTTRGAFEAEARAQETKRPPTRPRPPPVADQKHSAPLWSAHLSTYVSYSWREHNWKRWSTTAKLWKIIPDINVVIRAESKIHEAASGDKRKMPERPKELDYSEPLWYQAERLWVSYNSCSGNWMEWYDDAWINTRTSDWPQMPVRTKTGEENKSSETNSSTPSQSGLLEDAIAARLAMEQKATTEAETVKGLLAPTDVTEQNQKAGAAPQHKRTTWIWPPRFQRLLPTVTGRWPRARGSV